MAVITLTKENFEQEVLHSNQPVLVDFWATWCGPCRMMGPVIDEIGGQTADFKTGKVNVDEQQELAAQYGVQSIPTLIVFKNGEPAARALGARPKAQVLDLLRQAGV
jgi:thioredoxin 1